MENERVTPASFWLVLADLFGPATGPPVGSFRTVIFSNWIEQIIGPLVSFLRRQGRHLDINYGGLGMDDLIMSLSLSSSCSLSLFSGKLS